MMQNAALRESRNGTSRTRVVNGDVHVPQDGRRGGSNGPDRRALLGAEGPERLCDVRHALLDRPSGPATHLSGLCGQDPRGLFAEPARLAPDHIRCGDAGAINLLLACLRQQLIAELGSKDAVVTVQRDFRSAHLSEREVEMLSYAEMIAEDASRVAQEDIRRLGAVGFTDVQICDIALCASFRCFVSRFFDAVGAGPEPAFIDADANFRTA